MQNLGVDAIWISPFFMSPQHDFGYDVSNYCDINPEYGSLSDFDQLIEKAHETWLTPYDRYCPSSLFLLTPMV